MSTAGLATTLGIQLRTGWKVTTAWILALAATMVGTTASLGGLYDTQAKIDGYARALGGGDALLAINGRIYGLDTLGGVIANEFGFVASFALPLMGISLVARSTRRDEEAGRLEVLLAGRIGRGAPLVAAVTIAAAALALASLALAVGLVASGVPAEGSFLYSGSHGGLGLVFAGIAAVAAQVVQHARGVYSISLGALVVAYLLRGAGDVLDNVLTWLSPLGWAEETRAFGDPRWWPLLLSLAASVVLVGLAVRLNSTRDVGSSLLRRGAATPVASRFLRNRFGFALTVHRGAVTGWSIGAILVSGTFGALAQQIVDLMEGNEAVGQLIGGSQAAGADGFLSMAVLLLALVCGGFVVQSAGVLRTEETSGRLEPVLSGPVDRSAWLGVHVCTILGGLLVVGATGGLALGITAAPSTGDPSQPGRMLGVAVSYLPAVLLLAAVPMVLFSVLPRFFVLAWVVYAGTAVAALLGDALQPPGWLLDATPMEHVGYPPQDPAGVTALVVLAVVAVALYAVAFAGFRRRGIPCG